VGDSLLAFRGAFCYQEAPQHIMKVASV